MTSVRDELGAEPPAGVAALPAADQERLAGLVREAKRRQRDDLDKAFDATLKHVPFPVRPIARKLLAGLNAPRCARWCVV